MLAGVFQQMRNINSKSPTDRIELFINVIIAETYMSREIPAQFLSQKQAYQLFIKRFIWLISHRQINPGLFVNDTLIV